MAARPVVACEVALGLDVDDHGAVNDTTRHNACSTQLKAFKLKALTNEDN